MEKRGVSVSPKYAKIAITLENLEKKGIFDPLFPMLSIPFLDWFESYNWSNYSLLEFGSGNSSNYFGKRLKSVVSFETDKNFYDNLMENKEPNISPMLISRQDIEFGKYDVEPVDIVLMDSNTNRNLSTRSCLVKFKPDIYILDNSEWYPETCKYLYKNGYHEIPFWGIRGEDPDEKCTSVFLKDGYRLPEKNYLFYAIGSDPGSSVHDKLKSTK
jgi:hypothetical protein